MIAAGALGRAAILGSSSHSGKQGPFRRYRGQFGSGLRQTLIRVVAIREQSAKSGADVPFSRSRDAEPAPAKDHRLTCRSDSSDSPSSADSTIFHVLSSWVPEFQFFGGICDETRRRWTPESIPAGRDSVTRQGLPPQIRRVVGSDEVADDSASGGRPATSAGENAFGFVS